MSGTRDLVAVIRAVPEVARLDPGRAELALRRVFQALRIAVNEEFSSLDAFLRMLPGCLKPGGRVVYATCSLLERENQGVIEAFLAQHPDFHVVPVATVLRAQKIEVDHMARFAPYFVMLPHLHATDGFFGAVLERAR